MNGPSVFFGITFLVLGLGFIINHEWILGVVFFIITSFLFFTYSGVKINTDKKKIKKYGNLFGLFKAGKWQSLNKFKGVTLVPIKKVRTTFSLSNQQNSTTTHYFQIYLVNKANKPEFPIKNCKTFNKAQNSLDEFSIWLNMPVFSAIK